MSATFDRFLNARQRHNRKASLGRAYSVVRQTWRLTDDPQTEAPKEEVLATRRSASEAADLARESAWAYRRNGFHKPSGAWWGADGEEFHRFQVRGRARGGIGAVAVFAVAGLATFAVMRRSGRNARTGRSGRPSRKR